MPNKKKPVLFRRESSGIMPMSNIFEMEKNDLHLELEARLANEKKQQILSHERELLIHELSLHQLELEIQNRELVESSQELECAKNKYVNLFDNAPIGHLSLNHMGKIIEVNLTASKFLNKERTDLIGKSLSSWIAKDSKRAYSNHLNECLLSDVSDKRNVDLEFQIPGLRTRSFIELHSVVFFDFATQRKNVNVALIDLSENKRSEMLETKARELYQERSLRENYITALSHDLRTPITSSKLCAQMLTNQLVDEKQRKLFYIMVDELDRADRMIKELLDTKKIKGEHLPLIKTEFDICKLAKICIEQFTYLHSTSIIELKGEEELTGKWSYDGIRRIIENLIFNAIKYGSKDKPITVSIFRKGDQAQLHIHNMGNPISLRDQKIIFDAFTRTKAASKGSQIGWGLGLNLVSNLIKSHDGNMIVKSNYEEGTTFTLCLPIL